MGLIIKIMKLKDIKIGEQFRFINYGELVWIKRTVQGMNNAFSYCETTTKYRRRNTHKTTIYRLFGQQEAIKLVKEL